MVRMLRLFLATLLILHTSYAYPCDPTDVAFSIAVNNWRVASSLRAQPISASLVATARAHGSAQHDGAFNSGGCNAHSWTKDPSGEDRWDACCYDNANLQTTQKCMTDKPKQVTNNGYTGNGYEILATNRGNNQDGYVSAIKAWNSSPGHERYMMNSGGNVENAFGCSMNGVGVCFFGAQHEGKHKHNYGLCDGTSKRNSLCHASNLEGEGEGCEAGPCAWCGGGAWKCCKEGEVKNGCDGIEGRPNAHICVGGEDPPGTMFGDCVGPNCFQGTPSTATPTTPSTTESGKSNVVGGDGTSSTSGSKKTDEGGSGSVNGVGGEEGKNSNVGGIVGGVIGGLFGAALLIGVAVVVYKKKKNSSNRSNLDIPAVASKSKRGSAPDLPPRNNNTIAKQLEMYTAQKKTLGHHHRSQQHKHKNHSVEMSTVAGKKVEV